MARKYDVAVMHDFFVDRLFPAKSIPHLNALISEKSEQGGGGVHGVAQEEVRGGNAVNLASALAMLGMRTLLITNCDRAHEPLLRDAFKGTTAELRVKPSPPGLTVAFEGDVNVMLGDGRGASDFGPSVLDESDWKALESSAVVCSVNWAANANGTELLVSLRNRLGSIPIFLDPADFRDRTQEFGELLELILERRLVDWVAMNEPEALATAEIMGLAARDTPTRCMGIARRLGVVFDLHGVRKSFTSEGTRVVAAKVDKAKPRRLTGAGDVWDAGAICGRLRGMDEVPRLRFANAAAKLYLESEELRPPTLGQVLEATV